MPLLLKKRLRKQGKIISKGKVALNDIMASLTKSTYGSRKENYGHAHKNAQILTLLVSG